MLNIYISLVSSSSFRMSGCHLPPFSLVFSKNKSSGFVMLFPWDRLACSISTRSFGETGRSSPESKIKGSQTTLPMQRQRGYWLYLSVTHFLAPLIKAVGGLCTYYERNTILKTIFWRLIISIT